MFNGIIYNTGKLTVLIKLKIVYILVFNQIKI